MKAFVSSSVRAKDERGKKEIRLPLSVFWQRGKKEKEDLDWHVDEHHPSPLITR